MRSAAPFLALARAVRHAPLAALLAVLGSTCSPPNPIPPPPRPTTTGNQGGTRLGAVHLVTAAGVVQFRVWRDNQLGVDCTLRTASDGRLRCLPVSVLPLAHRDPGCTQPIAIAEDGCDEQRYVQRAVGDRFAVHALEAKERLEVAYAAASAPATGCSVVNGGGWYRALGPEVAPETFVAFELEPPRSDARIVPRAAVGQDGARASAGLYDNAAKVECRVDYAWDEVPRCLPQPSAHADQLVFSDPACENLVAGFLPEHMPALPFLLESTFDHVCPVQRLLARSGAPHQGALYALNTRTGACEEILAQPQTTYFRVDPVPATEYQAFAQYAPRPPFPRIIQRAWAGPGGVAVLEDDLLIDGNYLGQPCRFRQTADESWRCLPLNQVDAYADPACSARTAADPGVWCGVRLARQAVALEGSLCRRRASPRIVTLNARLAHVPGATAGSCVPAPGLGDRYDIGDPMALDLFESAQESIR